MKGIILARAGHGALRFVGRKRFVAEIGRRHTMEFGVRQRRHVESRGDSRALYQTGFLRRVRRHRFARRQIGRAHV